MRRWLLLLATLSTACSSAEDAPLGEEHDASSAESSADAPQSDAPSDTRAADTSAADTSVADTPMDTTPPCTGIDASAAFGGTMIVAKGGPASAGASTCSAQLASKTILALTPPKAGNYRITFSGGASAAAPEAAAWVRATCDDPDSEISCTNRAALLNFNVGLPAGTSYLTADGDYFAGGFKLSIDALPGCTWPDDCAPFIGEPYCIMGVCSAAPGCPKGFADCNGKLDDGCETDLRTDPENCGKCGSWCHGEHATATCAASACTVKCETGFADCNAMGFDGCEDHVASNPYHCGGCTTVCSGGGCADGKCTTPTIWSYSTSNYNVEGPFIDDTYVWWSTSSGLSDRIVKKVAIADGVESPSVTVPAVSGPFAMNGSEMFYLATSGSKYDIRRGAKGATTTTLLRADVPWSTPFAADDGYFYFDNAFAALPGGAVTTLGVANKLDAIVLDATDAWFYFAATATGEHPHISHLARGTSGTPVDIVTLDTKFIGKGSPRREPLAVTSTHVFFDHDGSLYVVPKSGGTPKMLFANGGPVVATSTKAYAGMTNLSGEHFVVEMNADGTIVRGFGANDNGITRLAATSKAVAWRASAGGVESTVYVMKL